MILGTLIGVLFLCMLSRNLFELLLRASIGGTIFLLILFKITGFY